MLQSHFLRDITFHKLPPSILLVVPMETESSSYEFAYGNRIVHILIPLVGVIAPVAVDRLIVEVAAAELEPAVLGPVVMVTLHASDDATVSAVDKHAFVPVVEVA